MAKDWIKMRIDLPSHPKVVRILSATKSDKFRVVGGLHAVWSIFDVHSSDGILEGYTPETMDHIIGWQGFCDALIRVGWMQYDGDETLTMPEFETHNGQSAKRRADETERKRKARNLKEKVRTESGQSADKVRSREEKRREYNNTPLPPKGDVSENFCRSVLESYRKWLPENPQSVNVTKGRLRKLEKLYGRKVSAPSRDGPVDIETDSLNFWDRYFQRAAGQPHLTGDSESGWQATFDWLITESNFYKVLENHYQGAHDD